MGGSKRHLGSAEVLLQVQKAEKEVGEAQTQVVLDLERRCLEAESQADSLRRQLEAVGRDLEAVKGRLSSELADAKVAPLAPYSVPVALESNRPWWEAAYRSGQTMRDLL